MPKRVTLLFRRTRVTTVILFYIRGPKFEIFAPHLFVRWLAVTSVSQTFFSIMGKNRILTATRKRKQIFFFVGARFVVSFSQYTPDLILTRNTRQPAAARSVNLLSSILFLSFVQQTYTMWKSTTNPFNYYYFCCLNAPVSPVTPVENRFSGSSYRRHIAERND